MTVEFLVLSNGSSGDCFRLTHGLCHGDLVSPYLLFIISKVLSRLSMHASETGFIEGIRINAYGPTLFHLLFVDDTLIFLWHQGEIEKMWTGC